MKAVQLLVVYIAMKGIYWTVIILYFSLTTAVMVMDISTGGMETSFTGQILIQSKEQIYEVFIDVVNSIEQSHGHIL